VTANFQQRGASRSLFATAELFVKLTMNYHLTFSPASLNLCTNILL